MDGQTEPDGLVEIFTVDTEQGRAVSVDRWRLPGVGGTIYQFAGRTIASWADQANGTVEFVEIVDGPAIGWTATVPLTSICAGILDYVITRGGLYAAASCIGDQVKGLSPKYVSFPIPYPIEPESTFGATTAGPAGR